MAPVKYYKVVNWPKSSYRPTVRILSRLAHSKFYQNGIIPQ